MTTVLLNYASILCLIRRQVTLLNYTKFGRPFVHRIRAEKIMEDGQTFFVTESCEEDDIGIAMAVRHKSGLPRYSVRSAIFDLTIALLVATGLVLVLLHVSNTLAAFALRARDSSFDRYAADAYDGAYLFSVFDNGLPLVG